MTKPTQVVTYTLPYQGDDEIHLCDLHADTCRYLGEVSMGRHLGLCDECMSLATGGGHLCGKESEECPRCQGIGCEFCGLHR